MASRAVFCGETFWVHQPGHYAMRDLLELAEAGTDTESAVGFRAITNVVEGCLSEKDRPRWEALARKHNSTGEDMVRVVMEALAARPTSLPADSSDGQLPTSPSSPVGSSSPDTDPLSGRPDLQIIRENTQLARTG